MTDLIKWAKEMHERHDDLWCNGDGTTEDGDCHVCKMIVEASKVLKFKTAAEILVDASISKLSFEGREEISWRQDEPFTAARNSTKYPGLEESRRGFDTLQEAYAWMKREEVKR